MSAFYLFVLCSVILIVVSIFKPHVHTEKSLKLTLQNPLKAFEGQAWKGIGNYKFLSILLFVTMIILYIIFR